MKAPGAKHPNFGIHVRTLRLVSLDERAIGLQLIQLEIEEGEGEVTLEASFEGVNLGLVTERLDQDLGLWHTHRPGKPPRHRHSVAAAGSTVMTFHRLRAAN